MDKDARRTYMREYKRKQYAENTDQVLAQNRAYYCRTKNDISPDEARRLGTDLPVVLRVRSGLVQLRTSNPELFREILDSFM